MACGYLSAWELLNSVEVIDMTANEKTWIAIKVDGALTPRFDPVFSPLNQNQLLLIGGVSDAGYEYKGVIIDT